MKFIKIVMLKHVDLVLSLSLALMGVYIFYPGAMSGDSVAQWYQVIHPDKITTWFPPIMVYLWWLLNKLTFGSQGMLIFHYVVYFLSIYIFAKVFYSKILHRSIYIFSGRSL